MSKIIFFVVILLTSGSVSQESDIPTTLQASADDLVPNESQTCEDLPNSISELNTPKNVEIIESENIAKTEQPTTDVLNENLVDTVVIKNTSVSTVETTNSTVLVSCRPRLENESQAVELVNATGLLALLESEANVTSRRSPAQCLAIMFYASWCSFSCLAAPHFNALPRAYPDIKVAALDAMKHYSLNTQFGIVGVPTILLFHNGRPTARFNDSEFNLKTFSQFITKYTGLEAKGLLNVTSADFAGPVSSVVERETDHWLILSWVFVTMCGIYFLVQSAMWRSLVETMKNIWREADEAQHEHIN